MAFCSMKDKFIRIVTILLLLFNGTGALYGSYHLITDPTGGSLKMPLTYLEKSPFTNYLIPGIVLLLVNGIFSFITIYAVLFRTRNYHWFVVAQGVLLSGWIIVQIIMLQMFYAPLHGTLLATGVILTVCGLVLRKLNPVS